MIGTYLNVNRKYLPLYRLAEDIGFAPITKMELKFVDADAEAWRLARASAQARSRQQADSIRIIFYVALSTYSQVKIVVANRECWLRRKPIYKSMRDFSFIQRV